MSKALTQDHKSKIVDALQKEIRAKFEANVSTVDDLKKLTPETLLYIRF